MACLIPDLSPLTYIEESWIEGNDNGNEADYGDIRKLKKSVHVELAENESKNEKTKTKTSNQNISGTKEKTSTRRNAFLNVFACFYINLTVQVLMSFIDIGVNDSNLLTTLNVSEEDAQRANNFFKSFTDVYATVSLFLMTRSSYRTTVVIGALAVCISFINISFLNEGNENTIRWYWQVWLCGPLALGVSCLKLAAIIPVLEYFNRSRMKMLVVTRLGTVLGAAANIGVMFAESLSWRTLFRISAAICIPCILIAFLLKEMVVKDKNRKTNQQKEETDEQNQNKDNTRDCCESIRASIKLMFGIDLFKNFTFWIMVVVFFFFSFGSSLPTFSLPTLPDEIKEQLSPPVESFYEVLAANVGNLIGLLLTYLLHSLTCLARSLGKDERKRKMTFAFSLVALSGYIMAILSIITSEEFLYYIVYILVLAIFEVLAENFRDESMPNAFGRINVRIAQGFLRLGVGVAGLTATSVQYSINEADNNQGWNLNFRVGAGFFLASASVATVSIVYNIYFSHTEQPKPVTPNCHCPIFSRKTNPKITPLGSNQDVKCNVSVQNRPESKTIKDSRSVSHVTVPTMPENKTNEDSRSIANEVKDQQSVEAVQLVNQNDEKCIRDSPIGSGDSFHECLFENSVAENNFEKDSLVDKIVLHQSSHNEHENENEEESNHCSEKNNDNRKTDENIDYFDDTQASTYSLIVECGSNNGENIKPNDKKGDDSQSRYSTSSLDNQSGQSGLEKNSEKDDATRETKSEHSFDEGEMSETDDYPKLKENEQEESNSEDTSDNYENYDNPIKHDLKNEESNSGDDLTDEYIFNGGKELDDKNKSIQNDNERKGSQNSENNQTENKGTSQQYPSDRKEKVFKDQPKSDENKSMILEKGKRTSKKKRKRKRSSSHKRKALKSDIKLREDLGVHDKGYDEDPIEDPYEDCRRLELALAPPTGPVYRNRRLRYEARREGKLFDI